MAAEVQESSEHKAIVQEEFTKQADNYAVAPVITDADRIARLVNAINPAAADRVLEIATGPGYVAMALAARAREVVGLDLTAAPLAIAERTARERGIKNVSFQAGSVDRLPFADGEFDTVVCRFAFHHFEQPAAALAEMCRVCRPGGTIAVQDGFASENPSRAAYWNDVERLRDHSHTRALALSELVAMLGHAGLEVESIDSEHLTADLENWLTSSKTAPDDANAARRMIKADLEHNLSGIRPFERDGKVFWHYRIAALVARKF